MESQGRNTGARRGAARERLLDAAARHFYVDGIAATGIDTITASAGVAKMSLYNNFASKSALIEAYIERRHEEWLNLYSIRLLGTHTPQERILAVFDAYIDHAEDAHEHAFRGCGLLNAAAELPAGDAGRSAVRRHKEEVELILHRELAQLTTDEHARTLATHLSFLLEGSMARAGLDGTSTRLHTARTLAAQLLPLA
ncbi:TetR/AcrR family transcriptional regulator [Mycetocola lacteus]|uniref:TetR/AcrR family transcriptional regulator n=1 Tax=Mycetocola lacteus TaxID=76637 RepID=A0A3L7AU33_9MICO|nr:TetR/AcrR family transcriptional regulator [Mycetocola lacteus]RLP83946.1 TetR/AcrR family transcriptional regulator [Mycetocola lacteus]